MHQFSKVELFGLVANEEGVESDQMLEEIVELQKEIISGLGLHYRCGDERRVFTMERSVLQRLLFPSPVSPQGA